MARQIRDTDEIAAVATDFDTFILPFDASLDLDSRTTYGTTDPDVDLSMVNVRHLKEYTQFRGRWVETPRDGDDLMTTPNNPELPYVENDVVFSATRNILYRRANVSLSTNPDPDSADNTGHWVPMGVQVTEGATDNAASDPATPPGLVDSSGRLSFRGYYGGDGVIVNNSTGEIRASNFSLTDIRVFDTFTQLLMVSDNEWHIGDIGIITGGTTPLDATDDGEGTYVYTGGTNGNNHTGTTVMNDWRLLRVPHGVVQMVAGEAGPVVTAEQIADAVDSLIDLGELGDVVVSSPLDGQHLVYDDDAANGGANAGWRNHAAGNTSLNLQNLANVDDTQPGSSDLRALFWDGTEWTPGTINIRGYQYDSTDGGIVINGLPSGSNVDTIPKIFTGSGDPAASTTGVTGFTGEAVRHRGDFYLNTTANTLWFYDGTTWTEVGAPVRALSEVGDVVYESQGTHADVSRYARLVDTESTPDPIITEAFSSFGTPRIRVNDQGNTVVDVQAFTGTFQYAAANPSDPLIPFDLTNNYVVFVRVGQSPDRDNLATTTIPYRLIAMDATENTITLQGSIGRDLWTDSTANKGIGNSDVYVAVSATSAPAMPRSGQVLTFDGTNWTNEDPEHLPSAVENLNQLSDVTIPGTTQSGQVLKSTRDTDGNVTWTPADDQGITSITRSTNQAAQSEGATSDLTIPADGVISARDVAQRFLISDIADTDVTQANLQAGDVFSRNAMNDEWVARRLNGLGGLSSSLNLNELAQTNITDPQRYELFSWSDGDDWINVTPESVLNRLSVEELMDVNHIDDRQEATFEAANNADGTVAENVRFSGNINIIGDDTFYTLTPDTQNQFQAGTFTVGDMVYFSRLAPPLTGPAADPAILGPYRVARINTGALHTAGFILGDDPGDIPQTTIDAIGGGTPDTGYYVYVSGTRTITGTNQGDLLVRNTSDIWENASPASVAAHPTNGISLFDLNNVRENTGDALSPGDILSWNGTTWQNAGAARAQLANADLDDLRDVVYDDDVLTTIYPVAIAENNRDAAENVSFSVIEPLTDRTTLRANSNGTENFESGTFAVNDQVYITELAPPLLDPNQANPASPINGPFRVVDLDGNNPIFVTGNGTGQIPVSLHNFVNGLTNVHYAYVTVATGETVRPADVLVRSADARQWVNETAAQMASNPNGGIQLQNLRDVTEIHETMQGFIGTATGVTLNSAARTTPASITLTVSGPITPAPATNSLIRFSSSPIIYQVVSYTPNFVVSREDNQLIPDADLTALNAADPTIETGMNGPIEIPLAQDEILAWDAANNRWRNRTLAEVSDVANTGIGLNDLNNVVTPTDTSTIPDNSVLHWDRTAGTWEPATIGSAQLTNTNLEDLRDVNPNASEGQVLIRREFGTGTEDDRWVPGNLDIETLNDVDITGTNRDGTITRTATSSTVTVPAVDGRGQPNISFDTSDANRHTLAVGSFLAFGNTDSDPIYVVVALPAGSTVIVAARRDGENTDNVASLTGTTLYLVDIPIIPEARDGEILTYRRTAVAGEGSWINVPLTEQDRLEFTEVNNTATLTGYRSEAGVLTEVRDTDLVNYDPNNANLQRLQLTLATFPAEPARGFQPVTLDWDQAYDRAQSQDGNTQIGVSANNPVDFRSQFLNALTVVTADSGNTGISLSSFTGSPNVTPAGGVPWFQRLTLNAGQFLRDDSTGLTGGTTTVTYTLTDNLGGTYMATQDFTWDPATIAIALPNSLPVNFWQRIRTTTSTTTVDGVSGSPTVTWSQTPSGATSPFTSVPTSRTQNNARPDSLEFRVPLYHGISSPGSITASAAFSRPADVTGTAYTANDSATASVVIPTFRTPNLTRFVSNMDALTVDDFLTGDFNTGDGLELAAGAGTSFNIGATTENDLTFAGANRFYWFGFPQAQAGITFTDVASNLEVVQQTPQMLEFSAADLNAASTISNVPTGLTTETYHFYGILLNAGPNRIRITL